MSFIVNYYMSLRARLACLGFAPRSQSFAIVTLSQPAKSVRYPDSLTLSPSANPLRGNPAYNRYVSNELQYYVYILFSKRNGTLYVGVTSDIVRRVWEHKSKRCAGFTQKYNVDKLGYYEIFNDINAAIEREKQLKSVKRIKKLELIEINNPEWIDLYYEII